MWVRKPRGVEGWVWRDQEAAQAARWREPEREGAAGQRGRHRRESAQSEGWRGAEQEAEGVSGRSQELKSHANHDHHGEPRGGKAGLIAARSWRKRSPVQVQERVGRSPVAAELARARPRRPRKSKDSRV